MTKPEDIPQWAWEKAENVASAYFETDQEYREANGHGPGKESVEYLRIDLRKDIARAILSAVEESVEDTLDAASTYLTEQYGLQILSHATDRNRITTVLRGRYEQD